MRIYYIFFYVVLASALLSVTACEKNYSSSFSTADPVEVILRPSGMSTRSAISGTAFPQGYDMLVSAWRNLGSLAGDGDSAADFFEGIHFSRDAEDGTWKPATTKFYPVDGTLDFLAVASAGLNTAGNGIVPTAVWGASGNVARQVVLTVPDNSVKFDDLMYGASNAQEASTSGTGIAFRHAMTCVVFLAKTNVAYDAVTNVGITIGGITVDGAKYSGTLTVGNPSAGGGSGDISAVWSSLGDQKTHIAARVWNAANLGTNTAESALSGLDLGTAYKSIASYPFGEAYVILPAQAATPFTVTYTIHNGFQSDGTTPLNSTMQYRCTPEGSWAVGKKNVYCLDFVLNEVQIVPSVLDWDSAEDVVVSVPE